MEIEEELCVAKLLTYTGNCVESVPNAKGGGSHFVTVGDAAGVDAHRAPPAAPFATPPSTAPPCAPAFPRSSLLRPITAAKESPSRISWVVVVRALFRGGVRAAL